MSDLKNSKLGETLVGKSSVVDVLLGLLSVISDHEDKEIKEEAIYWGRVVSVVNQGRGVTASPNEEKEGNE